MTISCNNNSELASIVTEDIESRIDGSILLDTNKKVTDAKFYKTGILKRIEYYILKIPSNLLDYLL